MHRCISINWMCSVLILILFFSEDEQMREHQGQIKRLHSREILRSTWCKGYSLRLFCKGLIVSTLGLFIIQSLFQLLDCVFSKYRFGPCPWFHDSSSEGTEWLHLARSIYFSAKGLENWDDTNLVKDNWSLLKRKSKV